MGIECVGRIVDQNGEYIKGDSLFGTVVEFGGYSEFVIVKEEHLIPLDF